MSTPKEVPKGAKTRKPRPVYAFYEIDLSKAPVEVTFALVTRSAVKAVEFASDNPDLDLVKLELS